MGNKEKRRDQVPAFTGKLDSFSVPFQVHSTFFSDLLSAPGSWLVGVPSVTSCGSQLLVGVSWWVVLKEIREKEETEFRVFYDPSYLPVKSPLVGSYGKSPQGGPLSTTLSPSGNNFLPLCLRWPQHPLGGLDFQILSCSFCTSCSDPCTKFTVNDPNVYVPSVECGGPDCYIGLVRHTYRYAK